jgi:hypothetical protein
LDGIRSLAPYVELILVETSGVSNGENVRGVLANSGLSHTILGLVNVGGFSIEDRDLYDSQLLAADRVFLTHVPGLTGGDAFDVTALKPVTEYLTELNCLDRLVMPDEGAIGQQIWGEIVRSSRAERPALPSTTVNPPNKHHQTVISLVLHPTVSVRELIGMLESKRDLIDRAKGVLTDDQGVRRDFDYLRRRNSQGEVTKTLTLSQEASRSEILDGRDHLVLFSRGQTGALKHEHFISVGLPNVTEGRIEGAQRRYPKHRDFYTSKGVFPSDSHEGDRFYAMLYPMLALSEQLPTEASRSVESLWSTTLRGYLDWRLKGLSELDKLREDGHEGAELTVAENLIAANLVWHAVHMSEHMGLDTCEQLRQRQPARRYFTSMSQLDLPPESGGQREFTQDYQSIFEEYVTYGLTYEKIELELVERAIDRACQVDTTNTWSSARRILERLKESRFLD